MPVNTREKAVCSPVVGLRSELGDLLSRTLPRRSSSPSLVGTCWEHHSLTGRLLPLWRKLAKDGGPSRVLAGAGCRGIGWGAERCPHLPQIFITPLHLFFGVMSLPRWPCAFWSIVMPQSCTRQGQRSTMTLHINNGATMKHVKSFKPRPVTYRRLPTHRAQPGLRLSPLSLLCVPACSALSSQLGKIQSVSTICSLNPPLPNYNTRRSWTIQHTPQSSTASD